MDNIRIGEKVSVTGNIHVHTKNNKGSLIAMVFAEEIDYENREQVEIEDRDIEAIKRFAKIKAHEIIPSLVEMFDCSIIGNNMVKESILYALVIRK